MAGVSTTELTMIVALGVLEGAVFGAAMILALIITKGR